MKEPSQVKMGYGVGAYEAYCESCGAVARMEFTNEQKKPLTLAGEDPDYVFAFMYFWTLLKLERECDEELCLRRPF